MALSTCHCTQPESSTGTQWEGSSTKLTTQGKERGLRSLERVTASQSRRRGATASQPEVEAAAPAWPSRGRAGRGMGGHSQGCRVRVRVPRRGLTDERSEGGEAADGCAAGGERLSADGVDVGDGAAVADGGGGGGRAGGRGGGRRSTPARGVSSHVTKPGNSLVSWLRVTASGALSHQRRA